MTKKFLLAAIAIPVIAVVAQCGNSDTTQTVPATPATQTDTATPVPAEPEPTPEPEPAITTTSRELIDALESNALAASKTYDGKRVTVSGVVGNIDASGSFFTLDPEADAFVITGVQISTGSEFGDQIAGFTVGQEVTVTGEVTTVGELLGYTIKAETISS